MNAINREVLERELIARERLALAGGPKALMHAVSAIRLRRELGHVEGCGQGLDVTIYRVNKPCCCDPTGPAKPERYEPRRDFSADAVSGVNLPPTLEECEAHTAAFNKSTWYERS